MLVCCCADISSQNQYKLMSMYAEEPEDYLLFQVSHVIMTSHRTCESNAYSAVGGVCRVTVTVLSCVS